MLNFIMMELAIVDNTKEWTVNDYLHLGEGVWCQLINGELIMSPSPSLKHQITIGKIFRILDDFAILNGGLAVLSPIDIYFDSKNVFQPDALLVSRERKNILSERGLEGAPDLIVEVLSVSNSQYDRYEKREKYHEFGVVEYWIVDPANETVEVFDLEKQPNKPAIYQIADGKFESLRFPKLKVDLNKVFS
ncbi:MAG: Uma2 family endonuclease [Bacteroidota bacterium]